MEGFVIILLITAILLFSISFFLPDATKELKEEIEQLSLKVYQDSYKMNRRLKVLEEELLLPNDFPLETSAPNQILSKQVELLYRQGLPTETIARQSALSIAEVEEIIATIEGQGSR